MSYMDKYNQWKNNPNLDQLKENQIISYEDNTGNETLIGKINYIDKENNYLNLSLWTNQ